MLLHLFFYDGSSFLRISATLHALYLRSLKKHLLITNVTTAGGIDDGNDGNRCMALQVHVAHGAQVLEGCSLLKYFIQITGH